MTLAKTKITKDDSNNDNDVINKNNINKNNINNNSDGNNDDGDIGDDGTYHNEDNNYAFIVLLSSWWNRHKYAFLKSKDAQWLLSLSAAEAVALIIH